MREGESQCAIPTHGNSADGAGRAAFANAVLAFNVRHEFLQKKIAVPESTVCGIDVKASPAFRCDDQKITHAMLLTQVIQQRPSSAVEQSPFVVAQAVQEIQNGIRLLCGVVSRGQVNAVMHDSLQNAALDRAAIDPALAEGTCGHDKYGNNYEAVTKERTHGEQDLPVTQRLYRIES